MLKIVFKALKIISVSDAHKFFFELQIFQFFRYFLKPLEIIKAKLLESC